MLDSHTIQPVLRGRLPYYLASLHRWIANSSSKKIAWSSSIEYHLSQSVILLIKNKRMFPLPVMWFIFFTCRKKKKRHLYILLQRFTTFFFYAAPLTMVLLELLTGPLCPCELVVSVPMLTAPYWFLLAPFSLARVFIDAFTVLPSGTACFGCPSLNIGAAGFSWASGSLACTC